MKMIATVAGLSLTLAGSAGADACADLTANYSKYDLAAIYFDRISRNDSSALRQEAALTAIGNILARQAIIVNMMIANKCTLPPHLTSTGSDSSMPTMANHSEISAGGKSMLLLVASGTAVKLRKS